MSGLKQKDLGTDWCNRAQNMVNQVKSNKGSSEQRQKAICKLNLQIIKVEKSLLELDEVLDMFSKENKVLIIELEKIK